MFNSENKKTAAEISAQIQNKATRKEGVKAARRFAKKGPKERKALAAHTDDWYGYCDGGGLFFDDYLIYYLLDDMCGSYDEFDWPAGAEEAWGAYEGSDFLETAEVVSFASDWAAEADGGVDTSVIDNLTTTAEADSAAADIASDAGSSVDTTTTTSTPSPAPSCGTVDSGASDGGGSSCSGGSSCGGGGCGGGCGS